MKILYDEQGDVKTVTAAIGVLITLIIAVLVFYNVAASVNPLDIDRNANWVNGSAHAQNATNSTLDQAATFFQIAPIIVIVIVAVVILKYVGMI